MTTVAERVIAILAGQALLPVDAVTPDAAPETLGLDSIAMLEAVFAIEETFDITVPFSPGDPTAGSAFDTSSVGALIAAVEELVARKAP